MTTETASYSYLADGTKVAARIAGGDELQYRGSFVYRKEQGAFLPSFEAVDVPGGRVFVTGSGTGAVWTPCAFVVDHLGSTRAIADLSAGTAVSPNRRKMTGFLRTSDTVSFAARADYGPCRKAIGPTKRVGPIILRLFGDSVQRSPTGRG